MWAVKAKATRRGFNSLCRPAARRGFVLLTARVVPAQNLVGTVRALLGHQSLAQRARSLGPHQAVASGVPWLCRCQSPGPPCSASASVRVHETEPSLSLSRQSGEAREFRPSKK